MPTSAVDTEFAGQRAYDEVGTRRADTIARRDEASITRMSNAYTYINAREGLCSVTMKMAPSHEAHMAYLSLRLKGRGRSL